MKLSKPVSWWQNKQFTTELDKRYQALESGSDKGFTVEQLEQFISKLRLKKYGK